MEFKKAMWALHQMCLVYDDCERCPMHIICREGIYEHPVEAEAILTKWVTEHPEKTIADDFFEKHPRALRGTDRMKDTPLACAYQCGYGRSRDDMCGTSYCAECWRRPLEEVE